MKTYGLLLVLVILVGVSNTNADNTARIRAGISNNLFAQSGDIVKVLINKLIPSKEPLSLPPMPLAQGGLVDVNVTKITLQNTQPTIGVSMGVVSGKGIAINLSNINGQILFDFTYKSGLFKGTANGEIDLSNLNVDNTLLITATSSGDPKVDLSVSVQKKFDLKIRIKKGLPTWLANAILGLLTPAFKKQIEDKVPAAVTPIIDGLVNKVLENLVLQVPVLANTTIVDLGLADNPSFTDTTMVADLRGSIYPKAGTGAGSCSLPVSTLGAGTNGDFEFQVSDSMVRCGLLALYEEGMLDYFKLASEYLKVNIQERLDAYGLGSSTLASPEAPSFSFLSNGIDVMIPIVLSVNMQSSPQGKPEFWLAVGLNVSLTLDVSVKNATALSANIPNLSVKTYLQSVGPGLPAAYQKEVQATNFTWVNDQLAGAIQTKVLPLLNAKLKAGVGLPSIAGVTLSKTTLSLSSDNLDLYTSIALNATTIVSHLNMTKSLIHRGFTFPTITRTEVMYAISQLAQALGFNVPDTPSVPAPAPTMSSLPTGNCFGVACPKGTGCNARTGRCDSMDPSKSNPGASGSKMTYVYIAVGVAACAAVSIGAFVVMRNRRRARTRRDDPTQSYTSLTTINGN